MTLDRLTCRRPPDDAKLTRKVDDAPPIPRPPIMGRQRLLLEHLGNFGARGQPAATVIDAVDAVEVGE